MNGIKSIDILEEDIIIRRGIERYMYVRQFVYGNVLDIACGVGYGSYLLSKNPDVHNIIAVDKSEKAITNARKYFSKKNIQFELGTPETVSGKFDMLVSLETIEYLENPVELKDILERCQISEAIISFPKKKTTHYNSYHMYDYTKEDIIRLFNNYECYRSVDIHDSTIMNLIRINRNGYTDPRRLCYFKG